MICHLQTFGRSVVLGVLLIGATVVSSHAQIGVSAGLNFEQASDISDAASDRSIALNTATGYHAGLSFEFGGDRFRLRPAVIFRNVGTYSLPQGADVQDAGQDFDVSVIEIPLDLRMTVLPIPFLNPYVMGGPMLALPRGEGDFSDATEDWTLFGNIGTGLSLSVASVKLQPEVRYQFGVTDYISDSFEIAGETITPAESSRFSAFSVRLTFMF